MHIIALGWIYVVSMMAITETSVVAGIMTFTFYCAIPLGIIWYLMRSKKRRSNQTQVDKDRNSTDLKIQQHDSNKTGEELETKN